MVDLTRNPFVVLGVPYMCSADESSRAFALRARGLRRAPDGAERLQELTWALNQIDQMRASPQLADGVYRIPADAEVLRPRGPGVLQPPPQPMTRRSPASEHQRLALRRAAQREAVHAARAEVSAAFRLPPR